MAENKMKDVAKLLGVEFGKSFKIKGDEYNPFIINNDGFIDCDGDESDYKLLLLLEGELEIEQPILTEKEKAYLKGVLRPFKDKVKFIRKDSKFSKNQEYIHIGIKNDFDIDFPNFQQGTMYKGMESDRRYTLEELGLFEEE